MPVDPNGTTQDLSRSIDQLVSQFSVVGINVPRLDSFKDVFEFTNEVETITATLPEDQSLKLLVKAFPPGRLRTWYDRELKPLIDRGTTWPIVKQKIIQRYSDIEDRDRHLKRLQGMKFVDNGHQKLFDYVEELLYSFDKAFEGCGDSTRIGYVKNTLPSSVTRILIHNNDFNEATSMSSFLKSIRQFDKSRSASSNDEQASDKDKINPSELATILKELVKEINRSGDNKPKVAAMQSPRRGDSPVRSLYNNRPNSPRGQFRSYYGHDDDGDLHTNRDLFGYGYSRPFRQRSPSPRRQSVGHEPRYGGQHEQLPTYRPTTLNYDDQNQSYNRNQPTGRQNNYQGQRFRSPSPQPRQYDSNQMHQAFSQQPIRGNARDRSPSVNKAFSDTVYYQKFGVPPTPCPRCGLMHWERHCTDNLN